MPRGADRGAAVLVDGGDSVGAAVREAREGHVPVGLLDVLVLPRRQLVPPDARELAAVVGRVVEMAALGIEVLRGVRRLALMGGDVLQSPLAALQR